MRRCIPGMRSYRESAATSVLRRGRSEEACASCVMSQEVTRVIRRVNSHMVNIGPWRKALYSATYTRLAFCRMYIDG